MLVDVSPERLDELAPTLSCEFECGRIVRFPRCPIPLRPEEDRRFLREEFARHLNRKNVSWYPEGNRFVGLVVRIAFPPSRAWMVLTDAVSHACVSGQHALVETLLVPLSSCSQCDEAPWSILSGAASS